MFGCPCERLPQHKVATKPCSKPSFFAFLCEMRSHARVLQRNPTCKCQIRTDMTQLACKGAQHKMTKTVRRASTMACHFMLGAVASACPTSNGSTAKEGCNEVVPFYVGCRCKHLSQHKTANRCSKLALVFLPFYVRCVRKRACLQRDPTCSCQIMTDTTTLACKGAQHKLANDIIKAATTLCNYVWYRCKRLPNIKWHHI